MATSTSGTEAGPRDTTFRHYNASQAATYAADRPTHSAALIQFIVDHHVSTGGKCDLLLDVGCGPGVSTVVLAPHFATVYGADAGEGMIQQARAIGGASKSGTLIKYLVCPAEDIDTIGEIAHGSVDMISVAVAVRFQIFLQSPEY
jgi:trans-aconitate 3-methyltransferase